ncbi:MAG TPA: hydrogenase maturation protease [Anaerolineales bacterium]|nr:hydrogenase maturation protease [Anaerolineales bacterium]
MKLIVVGIGQTLRGDDAAGVEAVHRWQSEYPKTVGRPDIRVEFSELPGLALLDLLEGFDAALLVDAVQSGAEAGTIHRLSLDDLAAFGTETKSAHGWGAAETLQLGVQLGLPVAGIRLRLIGIETAQVELGKPMSAEVEKALAAAAQAVEEDALLLLA